MLSRTRTTASGGKKKNKQKIPAPNKQIIKNPRPHLNLHTQGTVLLLREYSTATASNRSQSLHWVCKAWRQAGLVGACLQRLGARFLLG